MRDSLGDMMKSYEAKNRFVLDQRDYALLRLDGKAFHSYTKGLERPYDQKLNEAMDATAIELCTQIQGARIAYVQSDEISILLTGWKNVEIPEGGYKEGQLWMGGVEPKMVSISASIATLEFNNVRRHQLDTPSYMNPKPAHFDSRAWSIPGSALGREDVVKYFNWRREDCIRNSITMAVSCHRSHKQLNGLGTQERRRILREEVGEPWEDMYPGFKYGRFIRKHNVTKEVSYVDPRSNQQIQKQYLRTEWVSVPATHNEFKDTMSNDVPLPFKIGETYDIPS